MAKFDHPGIVRYNNTLLEKPPAGWQLDENKESSSRSPPRIKSWFKQLLSAVAYIHEMDMIHRDLKRDLCSRYSSKTDVYALGLILSKMCIPITGEDRIQVI
ncbi:hypothetical protein PMAYCL1PPCAC_14606 [Pristionchus mayeri]|uniref:Protein kinase n=1 Tax=Pristionchus mayeri TaxID=1317129 RepID=A0AAN4ZSN6_9BILA|nr:hypothetical protein PMAYCL1PPCAC_14606 [Pristionchus mayeri]